MSTKAQLSLPVPHAGWTMARGLSRIARSVRDPDLQIVVAFAIAGLAASAAVMQLLPGTAAAANVFAQLG